MTLQLLLNFLHSILEWFFRLQPWSSLALFGVANCALIFGLERMENKGFEGTVLGTLVMPYCSGLPNLIFAFVLGRRGGEGALVLENCLVNNMTNLTLLIGLPAILWSLNVYPSGNGQKRSVRPSKVHRINHLSLLLTLTAGLFFVGVLWALGRDGVFDFGDGLVLVSVFVFWQIFHVFDVLKNNVVKRRTFDSRLFIDFFLIVVSGYAAYLSIDQLVAWISQKGTGIFSMSMLGWLSGILMVLPNALLAFYYAQKNRADIVYTSQSGDGHICIPMCIGLFALFKSISVAPFFQLTVLLLAGATLVHLAFISLFGRLPRFIGVFLTGTYVFFLYRGLISN
jgi:cation:H+ antiporter